MKLAVFEHQKRTELSMIEVAHAILEQKEERMDFNDLVNEIQTYLEKTDTEIRERLTQFYTDLNTDGSFISLGENRWGLRSWYAINEIDEAINSFEEDEEGEITKKKRNKINAFETDIDWNADDSEDDYEEDDEDVIGYDDDDDDDEEDEVIAYDSDLKEMSVEEEEDETEEEEIENEETEEFSEKEADDEDFEEVNEFVED